MKKNNKASSYCRNINPALFRVNPLIACISLSLAASALASDPHLSGAIFTTTPDGSIVNENVRYTSKEEVFLDGGPGPNAPASAAALPPGYYFFQVTDPSGKCLLSSEDAYAGVDGGTCYDNNKKGGQKNSTGFAPEPLVCRLFYFDGNGGISHEGPPPTYTTWSKVKGQMVETVHECQHLLGSEYPGTIVMPDGETIQLYPFANTPNNGGVYKAWVATRKSVEIACGIDENQLTPYDEAGTAIDGTGVSCDGFFGFIPRWSKTDNFKVKMEKPPESFDIALRKFHDKNLNCIFDADDEYVKGWKYGITDPSDGIRSLSDATTDETIDPTASFSVLDKEHLKWLVDEYMWDAAEKGVDPLNTSNGNPPLFTHFPSFAELRTFATPHINGELQLTFSGPNGCDKGNILAGTEVTDDGIEPDGTVLPYDGFIPANYGAAYTVKNGDDEDPVLTLAFGNFGVAKLKVCKVFANGKDPKDPVENWKFTLTIPDDVPIPANIPADDPRLSQDPYFAPIYNKTVTKYADENGCATFSPLVPGEVYTIEEGQIEGWDTIGCERYTFDVESKLINDQIFGVVNYEVGLPAGCYEDISGSPDAKTFTFHNNCKIVADFDTKGYWHNKNGLQELTEADRDYVNGLAPYTTASSYFGAGDEPFDGLFEDGTPVDAAYNDNGTAIWTAGTWQSEVSHFLTDNNGNADLYDHKEQLAQQLLAFIFNTRHRGPGDGATIEMPDGTYLSVDLLITEAIAAWVGSDISEIEEIKNLLDSLNNNDSVIIIPGGPDGCPDRSFE